MNPKRLFCAGILLLAILFKFWLIAGMEITDEADDCPNYVAQILGNGTGPSFFGPGTGLWHQIPAGRETLRVSRTSICARGPDCCRSLPSSTPTLKYSNG